MHAVLVFGRLPRCGIKRHKVEALCRKQIEQMRHSKRRHLVEEWPRARLPEMLIWPVAEGKKCQTARDKALRQGSAAPGLRSSLSLEFVTAAECEQSDSFLFVFDHIITEMQCRPALLCFSFSRPAMKIAIFPQIISICERTTGQCFNVATS